MSVKRTLFLLFGSLILLLGALQLLLVHSLREQVNLEAVETGRELATQVLHRIDIAEIPEPEFEIPSREELEIIIQDELASLPPEHRAHYQHRQEELVSRELEKIARQAEKVRADARRQFVEAKRQAREALEQIEVHKQDGALLITAPRVEFKVQEPAAPAVATANRTLLLAFALTSAIALITVYYLARRLSQPLERLCQGLAQVGRGELGTQLPPEGMREVRQAIEGFNHMNRELGLLRAQEARVKEQAQLAELGEVARGLAHALRNPLHTLGLCLEELARAPDPRLADTARRKLRSLDKNIQALLTLSTSEVNRSQRVPLAPLLADLRLELGGQWQLDGIDEQVLRGAESELRSMLHTLISNALEAGGDQPIRISASRDDDRLSLCVRDQGPGLDPGIAKQLFQPHITTKAEGAGMGLYIAQRLARLHYGGDISLANHPDGGCQACLILPLEDDNETVAG
ncbi:HAMP domain-containing sensor histidine kinase [Gallaecimonas sp. GXIMD4217]|uniref:sensor histidine kinase n=1 Tax=Gallaecimonas sp. GXIMD4217 TaxID=3131927 RepID=UPI00311AF97C